jgi:hypothetical protein
MKSTLLLFIFFVCSLPYIVKAQTDTIPKHREKKITTIISHEIAPADTVSKFDKAVYSLLGDTLFTDKDFKIFKGQKLFVGPGSNQNEWYKTISLNSVFDWYGITLAILGTQNTETDEERDFRVNNLVRDCLHKEGTLYVKEIKKYGNARRGFWYSVILRSKPGTPNTNYRCNIQEALKYGEIVLPVEKKTSIKIN